MPEFYSVIIRWGNKLCFTYPKEVERTDELYAEIKKEFGDMFVDVVYRRDASEAMCAARDFTEAEQPF